MKNLAITAALSKPPPLTMSSRCITKTSDFGRGEVLPEMAEEMDGDQHLNQVEEVVLVKVGDVDDGTETAWRLRRFRYRWMYFRLADPHQSTRLTKAAVNVRANPMMTPPCRWWAVKSPKGTIPLLSPPHLTHFFRNLVIRQRRMFRNSSRSWKLCASMNSWPTMPV